AGARRLHRRGERGGPRRLRERLPAAQGDVALVLRARCSGEILMSRSTLLIVEDQEEMSHFLQEELREAGYEVIVTATGLEALDHLATTAIDVIITDLMMPGMKGDELLAQVRSRQPEIPVVIITAFGSIESAVEAMKAGAHHYVAKPFRIEQLLATIETALRERQLRHQLRSLRECLGADGPRIVAESPCMRKVMDIIARAAAADP